MQIFYIPDGHRRYAVRTKTELSAVYELGFRTLRDEIVPPICADMRIERLCVFLLSRLNLQRRSTDDLKELLAALEKFTPMMVDESAP